MGNEVIGGGRQQQGRSDLLHSSAGFDLYDRSLRFFEQPDLMDAKNGRLPASFNGAVYQNSCDWLPHLEHHGGFDLVR